ncbi:TGF-beta-activated kinase 1 and MAP3K7-binding protein 1-like isoform X2 [Ylistrum balloti]|uniref:TGF-beta-activated kinase 1 and MAP3K7-binding protein 1-like isoform X2 n=1 Tax=Ylistrum balloti TaxID=509963 RepID=UPI002905C308|nr:TGF-beta-activated kinase 1 and MAP3K7-binding protein 1-like isoform X2 [Ylistrum balloti]
MANSRLSNGSVGSPPRLGLQDHALSWTDDLPVCQLSGIGFSTNQVYREDGIRRELHEFEDRSFHFKLDDDCYLYGVFDGHDGSKASNFTSQRMPAELLLGQLGETTSDDEIKEVLNQAFIAVEKSFFESIDHVFAEKTTIQLQLPEGLDHYDACRQYPDIMNKLNELERNITGGTTATVALICHNKLYVANVGDSRALLCTTDDEGMLRVMQLSVDHSLLNEEELNRLAQLGLDIEQLKQCRHVGSSDSTRCIGDYHVKGGYKDIDILRSAVREPVIADPYVHGGINIDSSSCFLILMSDGLYQALQDAKGCDRVNVEVARMVAEEFSVQSTLNGVAQAVVDKVARIHHDTYLTIPEKKQLCQKRGDITLLVRNFNYPLANAGSPAGSASYHPVSIPFYQGRANSQPPVSVPNYLPVTTTPTSDLDMMSFTSPQTPTAAGTPGKDTLTSESSRSESGQSTLNTYASTNSTSTNSTQSSGETRFPSRYYHTTKLDLDADGKIEAYIDFSEFYRAIDELTEAQRESLNAETKPKSPYEPITEETESFVPEN